VTRTGRVVIIGAGPGDPGLITARGLRALGEADVVVYDRNVERLLRFAPPHAERIAAGAPAERDTAQDAISMLLAEKAREGSIVARLKWGDPFVFDSGAKEAMFLYEQRIPFEIVPGVPAAVATPAYAGVPVTYPGAGDAFVLLRGQEHPADPVPPIAWTALAGLEGTITSFVTGAAASTVLQQLLDHGTPPDTPAAFITDGTLPTQHTLTGSIATMIASVAAVDSGPGLLVVGKAAGLREHLRWFDDRPLFGRRIVVTRSPEQAPELADALEALGAQAVQAPTLRIVPPEDPEAIDRAAAAVADYDWVVFGSAGAATRFLTALTRGPLDLRALGRVRICAVGPSTADRLASAGIRPDATAAETGVEHVLEALAPFGRLDGQRVLVVRPDVLRDMLAGALARVGADVSELIAYQTEPVPSDAPGVQELYRELLDGRIDAVTFTSPSALRRFAAMIGEEQAADLLNTTTVVTIGPVTAAAARELGIDAPIVPDRYTVAGLVQALVETLGRSRSGRD
jgi:uroporphyrinogen III methyltransferase/synthase